MGAKFQKDPAVSKSIKGPDFTAVFGTDQSAQNQKWPDELSCLPKARPVLHYQNGAIAATLYPYGQGKAVILGFGLEGVATAKARAQILQYLKTVMGVKNPSRKAQQKFEMLHQ